MKVTVYRRWRTGRLGKEWYNDGRVTWLHVWWGSPMHHRWWAMSIYFYIRGA